MPAVNIRDLKDRASEIVRKVSEVRAPDIMTLRGKPSAMITPQEENEDEEYVIAHHPYFVMLRDKARRKIYEGATWGEYSLKDKK